MLTLGKIPSRTQSRMMPPVPASTPVFDAETAEKKTISITAHRPNSHQQPAEKSRFCATALSQKYPVYP